MFRIKLISFILLAAVAVVGVLFFQTDHVVTLLNNETGEVEVVEEIAEVVKQVIDPNADIENQKPLPQRPAVIKAIYATAWSAGNESKVQYFLDLLNTTELNAIVIDVKDYTGVVSYPTTIEAVEKIGASEKRIAKVNALIKRLHEAGVYVIGRVSVFQDTKLAYARPDLALRSSSTNEVWTDRKKVAWMDSSSKEVWDYNLAIAKDMLARGFDEVNIDYVRFASDGNLDDIVYPFFDATRPKHENMRKFFTYMGEQLPDGRLSADLFGLVTINNDDLGIGQRMEDAWLALDTIAPMTYPSHYAKGFNGVPNPAAAPYEIMKYSIDRALEKRNTYQNTLKSQMASSSTNVSLPTLARLRPWIQDFDLGADYTPEMVRAQIQAIEDSSRVHTGCLSLNVIGDGAVSTGVAQAAPTDPQACSSLVDGWMVWNPSNVYTREAFLTH